MFSYLSSQLSPIKQVLISLPTKHQIPPPQILIPGLSGNLDSLSYSRLAKSSPHSGLNGSSTDVRQIILQFDILSKQRETEFVLIESLPDLCGEPSLSASSECRQGFDTAMT